MDENTVSKFMKELRAFCAKHNVTIDGATITILDSGDEWVDDVYITGENLEYTFHQNVSFCNES